MDWLWQGVASTYVAAGFKLAIILLGSLVVGFMKRRYPEWTPPALYALGAAALITVTLFFFSALTAIQREPEQTAPENAEANIRLWLDAFGVTTRKIADESALFTLLATLNDGIPISISRPKKLALLSHGREGNTDCGSIFKPEAVEPSYMK